MIRDQVWTLAPFADAPYASAVGNGAAAVTLSAPDGAPRRLAVIDSAQPAAALALPGTTGYQIPYRCTGGSNTGSVYPSTDPAGGDSPDKSDLSDTPPRWVMWLGAGAAAVVVWDWLAKRTRRR